MFRLVAEEGSSGRNIWEWCRKVNLVNKSGKDISLSQIYLMLHNPYYYGEFEFPVGSGKWYIGKHKPLITKKLFEQVQKKLVFYPRSKWEEKNFIYKKLFKCASCGATIVGEDKYRKLTSGNTNYHIYYHCSRQVDYNCNEPYLEEDILRRQIVKFIEKLDFNNLNLSERLKLDLENFTKTKKEILILNNIFSDEEINLTEYSRYILRDGTITEKRNLITGLNLEIYLHNKELVLKQF